MLAAGPVIAASPPPPPHELLATALFHDLLGRPADPAGLAYWTNLLDAGLSSVTSATAITASDEYFVNLVRRDYEKYLGREPDAAGLIYWTVLAKAGLTDESLAAGILSSPEMSARPGTTDQAWIAALYEDLLGRQVDAESEAYWMAQLGSGGQRADVAYRIAGSEERARRTVEDDMARYLDRQVDPQSLDYYFNEMAHGMTDEQVLCQIVGSTEYFKLQTGQPESTVPVPRLDQGWQSTNAAIDARARQGNVDLLFIGDSITQNWESFGAPTWTQFYGARKAMNAGIGGDGTENILWRIEHGNLDGISPKVVVLMIGTIDSGSDPSARDVAAGVQAVVRELQVKLPNSTILLLGTFPQGVDPTSPLRQTITASNQIISGLADGRTVDYLDLSSVFLNRDGTLNQSLRNPDLIHPNAQGYVVWAQAMEPTLSKLLSATP